MKPFFLFLIACMASAAMSEPADSAVAAIQDNVKKINAAQKSYHVMSTEMFDDTSESGQLTVFRDQATIVKMIGKFFGETGQVSYEYYISGDRLFFVLEKRMTYNKPIKYDSTGAESVAKAQGFDIKKSTLTKNRYFFSDNRLIRWTDDNKKIVKSDSSVVAKKENEILNDCGRLMAKAWKKK
jgi:hypothetical protein